VLLEGDEVADGRRADGRQEVLSGECEGRRAPTEDLLLAELGGQQFEQVGAGGERVQPVLAHQCLPVLAVEQQRGDFHEFSSGSSTMATPRVQPAEAAWILCGKQEIRKPVLGSASGLCSFSIWQ